MKVTNDQALVFVALTSGFIAGEVYFMGWKMFISLLPISTLETLVLLWSLFLVRKCLLPKIPVTTNFEGEAPTNLPELFADQEVERERLQLGEWFTLTDHALARPGSELWRVLFNGGHFPKELQNRRPVFFLMSTVTIGRKKSLIAYVYKGSYRSGITIKKESFLWGAKVRCILLLEKNPIEKGDSHAS